MPYTKHDMRVYRKGYRAGARRIVLAYLGAVCEECGETDIRKLQIAHKEKINKQWRDYTDWLDFNNLKILCSKCNQREENEGRIYED